jgi:hypothetical protein
MTRIVTTEDKLRAIVQAAVHEELRAFGLRTDSPEQIENVAENLRFLATMRRVYDGAAATIGKAVLLALVGLFLAALALGMKLHLLGEIKPPGR